MSRRWEIIAGLLTKYPFPPSSVNDFPAPTKETIESIIEQRYKDDIQANLNAIKASGNDLNELLNCPYFEFQDYITKINADKDNYSSSRNYHLYCESTRFLRIILEWLKEKINASSKPKNPQALPQYLNELLKQVDANFLRGELTSKQADLNTFLKSHQTLLEKEELTLEESQQKKQILTEQLKLENSIVFLENVLKLNDFDFLKHFTESHKKIEKDWYYERTAAPYIFAIAGVALIGIAVSFFLATNVLAIPFLALPILCVVPLLYQLFKKHALHSYFSESAEVSENIRRQLGDTVPKRHSIFSCCKRTSQDSVLSPAEAPKPI